MLELEFSSKAFFSKISKEDKSFKSANSHGSPNNPSFICLSEAWAMHGSHAILSLVSLHQEDNVMTIIFIILAQKVCRGQRPNGAN